MLCPGHRIRPISHIAGISGLHSQEALLEATVVMNEILDPEFHPIFTAENDPEFFGYWFTCHGRQHFRVATGLNRVICIFQIETKDDRDSLRSSSLCEICAIRGSKLGK